MYFWQIDFYFNNVKFKRSTTFLFLSALTVFLFYFLIKCIHFYRSDYTSDIFCHFQISRDWLLGKPLFYENCFGFHSKLHNYFLDIFMGPFTYVFNAYGLFIVLFGLVIGALVVGLLCLVILASKRKD